MKNLLPAALCGLSLLAFAPPTQAENAVAVAVQRLHLSPQQLLSLRDFLGPFSRGVQIEASGNGLFVLRDARSMGYAGEFSLRTDDHGTLTVDRIGGPATLDSGRKVGVPLKLDAKARLQATAALSDSQALAPTLGDGAILPPQQIAGATLTNTAQPASVLESRAVFFRDGSGYTATVRIPFPAAQGTAPALRIADRYYARIKSDGKQAWRDATVEVDGDVPLAFADLENRYGCAWSGVCRARALPAPLNLHVIRWGRQSIAAVPVTLLAQLAPPPEAPPPAAGAPASPEAATPQPPVPDTAPAPIESPSETPQRPSGI